MRTIDYFFHTDFSSEAQVLKDIPLGPLNEDSQVFLSAILSSLDNGEYANLWTTNPDAVGFVLPNAKVTLNGLNSQSYPTKYTYSNLLVLEFDEPNRIPFGRFYLQYNLETDGLLPPITPEPTPIQTEAGVINGDLNPPPDVSPIVPESSEDTPTDATVE